MDPQAKQAEAAFKLPTRKEKMMQKNKWIKGLIILLVGLAFSCTLGNEVAEKDEIESVFVDLGVDGEVDPSILQEMKSVVPGITSSYIKPYTPGNMIIGTSQSFEVMVPKSVTRIYWSYTSGLQSVYGGTYFIALLANTVGLKKITATVLYTDDSWEELTYQFEVISMLAHNPSTITRGISERYTADVESGYTYQWTLSSGLQGVYGNTYPDYTFIAFVGNTEGTFYVQLKRTHTATGYSSIERKNVTVKNSIYYIAESWDYVNYSTDRTVGTNSPTKITRSGWTWYYNIDIPNISGDPKFNWIYVLVKDSDYDYYNERIWITGVSNGCPILEKRDQ